MDQDFPFPLQILLKDRTKTQISHFPPTIPQEQKLANIRKLYRELLAPNGVEQGEQTISIVENEVGESSEESAFAQMFIDYADEIGIEAMALLMEDKKSIVFISRNPDTAVQSREDMILALRRMYPRLV